MYCVNKLNKDMYWIGGSDRKQKMFEGVVPIDNGMAYNSYFVDDDKTVVLDAVDESIAKGFYENIDYLLHGRKLDYVIVNHVEPDHSAALEVLMLRHPEMTIIGSSKIKTMLKQYLSADIEKNFQLIKEKEELVTGKHVFTFINAPMVHWPEVMVTYDKTAKVLFSADAFGLYGAVNGHIFADKYDFERDWLPEARHYYTTIVGKYGQFTESLLKKIEALDVQMICPLHGMVIREDLGKYLHSYHQWATYTSEEKSVLIVYGSPYGNTKNAAEILASELVSLGVEKIKLYDVSAADSSKILSDAFKMSNLVIAAPTYNAGIFIKMEETLLEMKSMALQNKKVSIIENGSWNPASGKQVKAFFDTMKNIEYVGNTVTIKSAVKEDNRKQLEQLARDIAKSINM